MEGELDVLDVHNFNTALVLKWLWKIITELFGMMQKLLWSKCESQVRTCTHEAITKPQASGIYKGMCMSRSAFWADLMLG